MLLCGSVRRLAITGIDHQQLGTLVNEALE
jgi:hypothetical protein